MSVLLIIFWKILCNARSFLAPRVRSKNVGMTCLLGACEYFDCKSTRYFPTCSHNFPKAGEARFQGRSRLFRLLGKFPYLGESRRILMAVSSKTSSKTRFCYAATRRISSAAVQPSIWA